MNPVAVQLAALFHLAFEGLAAVELLARNASGASLKRIRSIGQAAAL